MWSESQIHILKEQYVSFSDDELVLLLEDKTIEEIRYMAFILELKRNVTGSYFEFEEEYLFAHYPYRNNMELAALLSRDYKFFRLTVMRYKLKKSNSLIKRIKWTSVENDYLRYHYSDRTDKELGQYLKRSISNVNAQAKRLGLEKSEVHRQRLKEASVEKLLTIGYNSRFKKGLVPANKGKKLEDFMPPYAIEKLKKTQFKKGIIPHNTLPIGSLRLTRDGYYEIKVKNGLGNSKDNYQLYHRFLWEKKYGPIPKDMILTFKPGVNRMKFTVDDLVLKTRLESILEMHENEFCIAQRFFGLEKAFYLEHQEIFKPLVDLKIKIIKLKKLLNNGSENQRKNNAA